MNQLICSNTPADCDAARGKDYQPLVELTKFEGACEAARELAKRLGDGWAGRVWENLGWHYEALSPCRRITVSPSTYDGKVTGYSAAMHEAGSSGMPAFLGDSGHGKTPQAAVAAVARSVKARVASIQKLVEGL